MQNSARFARTSRHRALSVFLLYRKNALLKFDIYITMFMFLSFRDVNTVYTIYIQIKQKVFNLCK